MIENPPTDLVEDGRGRSLWQEVTASLELDVHEAALLHEAARCLDTLDQLDDLARHTGYLLPDGRIGPWVIEARQQRLAYARVIAALRLPEDLSNPERRPQRRSARGAYKPRQLLSLVQKEQAQ